MNVFGLILDKEKTIERIFKICQFYNVKNVDLAELMYTTEVEISNWKTISGLSGTAEPPHGLRRAFR